MLSGIYYGAQYGGSTTSILVNIPGEASSVVTCLDGYQMAKKGRAGPALESQPSGLSSGARFSVVVLMLLAPPLARMALKFGPPEMFAVMFFGFTMIIYLRKGINDQIAHDGRPRVAAGLRRHRLFNGGIRYTLGIPQLTDGSRHGPGFHGVIRNLRGPADHRRRVCGKERRPGRTIERTPSDPTRLEGIPQRPLHGPPFSEASWEPARRRAYHFVFYRLRHGEETFQAPGEVRDRGDCRSCSSETANNAACGAAFVPLLNPGDSDDGSHGVLLGGFMIKGVTPGLIPHLEKSPVVLGGGGSMYIGNAMLLILQPAPGSFMG